jgi:solute carrier family 30 (zinc transporter), member 1
VNGVFLVALCLSIFLEAIQRFFEPQEVSHPMLVLIVGCCGLASNIVGLFLFHDHGHSHGGGGHSHGPSHGSENTLAEAEEGHARKLSHSRDSDTIVADESGNIADVLPEARVGNWPTSKPTDGKHISYGTASPIKTASSPSVSARSYRKHNRSRSRGYSGLGEIDELPIHPASFRNEIIAASRLEDVESAGSTDSDEQAVESGEATSAGEQSPLLSKKSTPTKNRRGSKKSTGNGNVHSSHNHAKPQESAEGSGGHSHADLNMRGVFLHVMGDALGNIGVIGSALFIWLTDFSWRFYSDPLISLIITVIILCSAIPLCKAASRILLQAVPNGLSVDDIREDILNLPDVVSCHHLHVWQLSDTKLVASLHVQVAFEFKGEGSQRYMQLARQIRKCLHEYGIHSSTIQPEFCSEAAHGHRMVEGTRENRFAGEEGRAHESEHEQDECLLDCDDDCGDAGKCCPPDDAAAATKSSDHGSHDGHNH